MDDSAVPEEYWELARAIYERALQRERVPPHPIVRDIVWAAKVIDPRAPIRITGLGPVS